MSSGGVPFGSCLSGSLSKISESDPGSFQITDPALGLRACVILHVPLKSRVSGSPLSKSHWSSKPDILGACLPGAGPLGLGILIPFGRTSAIVIILPFVGHLPRGVGLDQTASLLPLPMPLWFLLYIFSCRKSFLLVFRLFSLIVAQ